jgi:cysteine-rich repeat protein
MHIRKLIFTALCMASPIACSLGGSTDTSALSGKHHDGSDDDCTLTQGYWKNHADAWAVASLKLGTVSYSKAQLIAILKTPVKGNGLLQLAHQLIAAKLNIAAGASDADVKAAIQQADALIGALVCPPEGEGSLQTSVTASLTAKLDAFNSGEVGPGHCGDDDDDHCDGSGQCDDDDDGDHCDGGSCGSGSDGGCDQPTPVCGNGVLEGAEACDDGNLTANDGCSPTCIVELPVCGNGIIEVGETCDDGNTTNGDGCSSVCLCEPCTH